MPYVSGLCHLVVIVVNEYSAGRVFAATTRVLLYFLLLFYSKKRILVSKFAILNAII
jgi:hypothetical protein